MKLNSILIVFISLFLLSACERSADITTPQHYNNNGVSFDYPGNWDLTEDTEYDGVEFVSIESSGSALFVLQIYPEDEAWTLEEFTDWYSKEANNLIPIGKMTTESVITIEKKIKSVETKGKKELFSVTFLGQEVPHKREYYVLKQSGKVVFIITQLALEDQKKIDAGFDLIFNTISIKKQ